MSTPTPARLVTNEERLITLGVAAMVSHPTQQGAYGVDSSGRPIILPGMAGVCVNARVGDRVFGWAADHLEAGVSAGHPQPKRHLALQVLACVGNHVRVTSGPCAGAEGVVTGKHAYVLIDFPQAALDQLAPGDRLLVRARGQGLQLGEFPRIVTRSCSPELIHAMPLRRTADGALEVPVVAELPPYLMGAGIGMNSEWANCDVMLTHPEPIEKLGLGGLRIGDVVAMPRQDHRYGRGYRDGMCAIGIIAHGIGVVPGHGTGVITIMSGPQEDFTIKQVVSSNIREYLQLPR
ncbi:MAG TPA: DUF4438 domain-containing protein [Chloroflexota bacterium]|nr:DUF4438 domain-containing protein [Chloroflexota bacterium]